MYGWTILDSTALEDDSLDLTNANWHKDGTFVLISPSSEEHELLDCFVWRTSEASRDAAREEVKVKMIDLDWFSEDLE